MSFDLNERSDACLTVKKGTGRQMLDRYSIQFYSYVGNTVLPGDTWKNS